MSPYGQALGIGEDLYQQLLSNARLAAKRTGLTSGTSSVRKAAVVQAAQAEQDTGEPSPELTVPRTDAEECADFVDEAVGRRENQDAEGASDTQSGSSSDDDDPQQDQGRTPAGDNTQGSKDSSSWPLAAWQHVVAMPGVAHTGGAGGAMVNEKAFCSKLVRAPLQSTRAAEKASKKVQEDTAGDGWFGMKAQTVTEAVKRDWRLLRLRATYDPKRFYKSFDSGKIPKYFQMGTVVEGSGEFYSARLTKKERKATLTAELLADIKLKEQRKRRYETLQAERQELAKKRKKVRALHKRSKHRPKH